MDKNTVFVKSYNKMPPINHSEVLRYLRIGKADDTLLSAVVNVINDVLPLFEYKLCFECVDISLSEGKVDFGSFCVDSSDLYRRLSGCSAAVIFCAGVGVSIDRTILRYSKTEMSKSVIAQAVGTERIEALCSEFCTEISLQLKAEGLLTKPRFSPGFGDFSLSFQKDIFSLIKPEKNIGVTLNSSLIMSPSKSVTAIVGIYEDCLK